MNDRAETTPNEKSTHALATPEAAGVESNIRNPKWRAGSAAAVLLLLIAVPLVAWSCSSSSKPEAAKTVDEHGDEGGEHAEGEGREVKLSPESLLAAKLEIESVTERSAVAPLRTTGAVEPNAEQTQQVTPLVSGRVERVHAVVGDCVKAGSTLAVISSPDVAEMAGKLREAETRLTLAKRNVERVRRAENRAGVLSAKARLDEAEASLRRTRRLVDLGVGAGKDLIAAETMFVTAKAEYDYQSNIAVNREVQEAQAEVETATTEVGHLRESIRSLGGGEGSNISQVTLRAPNSGRVTERLVNVGAGVAAGSPMFTIGNLSSMWVIARVPESQVGLLRTGSPAEVQTPEPGAAPISGRVNYIDPALDEATRTARVRVEVPNPGERLKAGMFVQIDFQGAAGSGAPAERELVVPASAVQRIGERTVVFVPVEDEEGAFEVRDIEVGGEINGYRRVLSGLEVGEKVVANGSFTLKTQLMKGEMGEHGH